MPTQLVKALLDPKLDDQLLEGNAVSKSPDSRLNALSWNHHFLCTSSLETIFTLNHPSSKVQAERDAVGLVVDTQLPLSGATRMRDLAIQPEAEEQNRTELIQATEKNENLAVAIQNADLTWRVARKVIVTALGEDWMSAKHANLSHN